MANGSIKLDEIGSWSREKLQMLEQYLAAYVSILSTDRGKQYCSDFHYIDAFAGATEHIDKETGEYVDGSPRVALKTQPPFASYTFIEKNRNRVKNVLEPLAAEFSTHVITPLYGDCNERILQDVLPQFPSRKWKQPSKLGFIFLDPYGTNLEWKTVEAIGKAGTFDVFINLSVMGVMRQAPGKPPLQDVQDRISQFMGGSDWFNLCYQTSPYLALPGLDMASHMRMHDGVADKLANCYKQKLETCFKHVTPFKMMYSSKNSPIYALIFASQAETAKKKMQAILNKKS